MKIKKHECRWYRVKLEETKGAARKHVGRQSEITWYVSNINQHIPSVILNTPLPKVRVILLN
jgi:hypothetical protein